MKAWVLDSIGNINYKDVEKPEPSAGEVLVKVGAAGICGSDIPRTYTNGAHKMPLILGHEFSGKVVEAADSENAHWIGKKVGIFPLIPCKKCPACLKKQYEMCSSYSYLGSRQDGGFAEYVTVPEWNLLELPANISMEAAAMLEPMAVAVHAMKKAEVNEASTVVVWGAGTIGLLLAMFLKEAGVKKLLLISNHEYQADYALSLGLAKESICNCQDKDPMKWILDKTEGNGPDVFYECVGKASIFESAIEITAGGGTIVTVGNPYGDVCLSKDTYWKILRRQLKIVGTWNSSYLGRDDADAVNDSWNYVLKKLKEGSVKPEKLISHKLKGEDLDKGLMLMRDKSEPYVKVMSIWD